MVLLIIYLSVLLALLYFSYEVRGRDIFSPSVLLLGGYVLTSIFATYNAERWKTDVSLYILFLITLGITSFVFTESFVKRTRIKKNNSSIDEVDYAGDQLRKLAEVNYKFETYVVIAICLAATFLVYREMVRIAYSDFQSWGNIVYNYKVNKALVSMSGTARLAQKATKSAAFVFGFIFANNITNGNRIRIKNIFSNILYLIPGTIYIVQQMFLGARIGALSFILAVVFFVYFCGWRKSGKRWSINISRLIKIITGIVLVSVVFFQVREFVGGQQQTEGVIDYVATYVGGSYDLFGQYLQNPGDHRNSIEVFSGIVDNMQSYLGLFENVKITTSHEFRSAVTGVNIGNTYTAFRSCYNDYGVLGIILLSSLMATIFCGVYFYITRRKRLKVFSVALLIIYAMEMYALPFHFFTDYFFARISINMILDFVFAYIVCMFVFKKKYFSI